MTSKKVIVMLGTDFHTMGGISAVVNEYRRGGLFERFPVVYLSTHCDGGRLAKLRFFLIALLRHLVLLGRGRVGLVHVHVASDASFWRKTIFLFPVFLLRIPAIVHLHGAEFSRFYEQDCGNTAKWIVRKVFDNADCVVVLSETWKRWLAGITRNARIQPINNPVDLPVLAPFALREPASILFLGRLGRRKGTYDLLTAVARILPRHPELKLQLGGDGEQQQVRSQADRLGIGAHVEILGWISGERKSALLRRASIYVLPSYAEGLPMSVLEAMAAGLPVVSTPVGGIPEVVGNGVEGALVAPGDVEALAFWLDSLLSDAALRRRMGQAARNKAECTFASDRVLPQVEGLYRELGAQI